MRVILLTVLLMLTACRHEVKREVLKTEQVEGRAHCSEPGFCFGYSFSTHKYEWGYHISCSGKQDATFSVDTVRITYDDKSTEVITIKRVLKRTGECDT